MACDGASAPAQSTPTRRISFLSTIRFGYLRHIVQAQILILLLFAVTSYSLPIHILWEIDPLLGISAALAGAVIPLRFILIGSAMLLAALVAGRAFCGWICPLGFVQDLISSIKGMARRLRRDLRILDEGTMVRDRSHLILSKGDGDVIGHVIWHEGGAKGLWRGFPWKREDRVDLEEQLGVGKDFVEVNEVWLRKKHDGKGLEKRVLDFFEEFVRDRGHGSIVFHANHPATVSMYRERGCEEGYLGRDHHVFHLALKGKLRMPEVLRFIKYMLLLGGLIMPVIVGWTLLEWITPLSVVPRVLSPLWGVRDGILFGILIFLIPVTLALITEKRAWCRYVCPLGAILSLPSAKKSIGIKIDDKKCIKCLKCERNCTMGIIDVKGQSGLRWDSECIACLTCRDNCPVDAIGLAYRL